MRENLIQNAVNFLSDPKVASSADDRKRRFLQTKGLTNQEIDEAFKRVGSQVKPSTQQLPQQIPTQNFTQPQQIVATPPPIPQYRPTIPIPSGPVVVQTPWKTLIFLTISFVGLGNLIIYIVKKWIKNKFFKKEEKKSGLAGTLTKKLDNQLDLCKQTIALIKKSLVKSITSKDQTRLDDKLKIDTGDLSQEIESVQTLIEEEKYEVPFYASDSPLYQQFPEIKSDLKQIRSSVLLSNSTSLYNSRINSVPSYTPPTVDPAVLEQSQKPTMPWKTKKPLSSSQPDWITKGPNLSWLTSSPATKPTEESTTNNNDNNNNNEVQPSNDTRIDNSTSTPDVESNNTDNSDDTIKPSSTTSEIQQHNNEHTTTPEQLQHHENIETQV
eukprot:TRINITY_DN6241_c0_g1_i1.p1 TRINITY_DN6241_c0_g1~~TRINITY_DN6241_c0_g1_i1.p1  ORF type:complete len:383 (-),score=113.66 TRINITY_DN6241_c0_g1_i1:37-1185(-)